MVFLELELQVCYFILATAVVIDIQWKKQKREEENRLKEKEPKSWKKKITAVSDWVVLKLVAREKFLGAAVWFCCLYFHILEFLEIIIVAGKFEFECYKFLGLKL